MFEDGVLLGICKCLRAQLDAFCTIIKELRLGVYYMFPGMLVLLPLPFLRPLNSALKRHILDLSETPPIHRSGSESLDIYSR